MSMPKLTHLDISPFWWSNVDCHSFWATNHALFSQLTHLDTGKLILPHIYGLPNLTHLSICVPSMSLDMQPQWGEHHMPIFTGLDSLVNLKVCMDSHAPGYQLRRVWFPRSTSITQLTDKSALIPQSVQTLVLECANINVHCAFDSIYASFPWINGLDVDSLSTTLTSLGGGVCTMVYLPSRQLEISIRHGETYPQLYCPNVTKLTIVWFMGDGVYKSFLEISGGKSVFARGVQRMLKNLFFYTSDQPTNATANQLRHLKMTSSAILLHISCKFLREIAMFANVEVLEVPRYATIMDDPGDYGMTVIRF
jgi:hypothetical protein